MIQADVDFFSVLDHRSQLPAISSARVGRCLCFVFLVLIFCAPGRARADSIDSLADRLKNHSSYKVRATAALVLARSCDIRAYNALVNALRSDASSVVRATAASSLSQVGLTACASVLKQAARSSDPNLKAQAKKALARLCPASPPRNGYYVNLDRITYKGPSSGKFAVQMLRCRLGRILTASSDTVISWTNCAKPSASALGKRRVKGFYLDVVLKLSASNGDVSCRVKPTFFAFPRAKLLTTGGGAKVKITGDLTPGTVDTCLSHAVGALKTEIVRTLRRL